MYSLLLDILTSFCWTVISHQSFSPFPSTSVGALGLFTFLPQCTVHNMRISELGVPVYSRIVFNITLERDVFKITVQTN